MAGHSHAKNVANKKKAMDKKKAKIFMKVAKIISVAIKEGGSTNPDFNPKLRLALKMAQNANLPKDIVKKAIETKDDNKKIETILYEGYIDGIAIIAQAQTENKNKTTPEIKFLFSKANATLAEPNSVIFMFDKISKIECKVEKEQEEEFLMDAITAGAEDVKHNTAIFKLEQHHQAQLELEKKWEITFAELTYQPNNYAPQGNQETLEKFLEKLEEHEDIEECWHNYPLLEEEDQ